MNNLFTFVFLFLLVTSLIYSKSNLSEEKVTAIKLEKSIILDGILNEDIWQKQSSVTNFTQRDPDEGLPATEKTKTWIAYDDSYIYVAAKLYDSNPKEIDVSLARRDSQRDSDWFTLYLDPYLDRKTGYYFSVNAGGSIRDGVYYNDSWNDSDWDGIWEVETGVDDKGWSVEMRIPFSQLRFNSSDIMTWGVNFFRQIKRKNEHDYFVMVPKDESGFVSHFALLEGINDVEPSQRFEALPYIVQKAQYLVHDADDPFYSSNQYQTKLGADFKVGIGTNLNLDMTVNPDFGQVEVDPAVLNLSAFETYFQEKRPFFIEGSNIFSFGVGGANSNWGFNFGTPTLFYSRRIGRTPQGSTPDNDYEDFPNETSIIGAAKLTGKIDESWSIGALSAVTERAYSKYQINGNQFENEVEPLTHYGVFRTQKEFNEGKQGIGLMFTSVNRDLRTDELNNNLSDQAYTFGVDSWTYLDQDEVYALNAYAVGSYTAGSREYLTTLQERPYRYFQRPDATYMRLDSNRTSLSGIYSRIMLNKQSGNFYINSALGVVSPGFEYNDLGFQWMADRINGHTVIGYRWYETDGLFRRKSVYISHARTYDFEGNNQMNLIWGRANFEFENYYGFDMVGSYNFESYTKSLTRGGPIMLNPTHYSFHISAYSDSRENIIVRPAAYYSSDGLGSYHYNFWVTFEWRPSPQIEFSIQPDYSFLHEKSQWVENVEDLSSPTFGNRYIFANIDRDLFSTNIRLNWTFTPTLSLQLYLQPLFAVGHYKNFKEVDEPGTLNYNDYGKNGSTINYDSESEEYEIDPDGEGETDPFRIDDPDFNFKSLRGNIVLRWEVLPGSIFYFVWTHDQTNSANPGKFNLSRDFKDLWSEEGDDIFLVKFSYWFDI